ncbi:SHOCT domain-containing protein [Pseudonocardia sp. RS010]|uniref:SHOCT domain-containing protein n=1 Tax=Pseudonocardia sp. RS010 TaxID=3385979 RepID=UPI0039A3B3CA
MSGWGYALTTVSMVLFWGLIIFGVIALIRYLGRADRSVTDGSSAEPIAEQVLGQRFARGEIDEQDYRQRLDTLRGRAPADREAVSLPDRIAEQR